MAAFAGCQCVGRGDSAVAPAHRRPGHCVAAPLARRAPWHHPHPDLGRPAGRGVGCSGTGVAAGPGA